MTGPGDQPDKMAEVAGLAAAIADRIFEQHEAGTSIPPGQFRMLVHAARMLLDNGVPWPPSVAQLMMEVARRVEAAKEPSGDTETKAERDDVVTHLTQARDAAKRQGGATE